MEFFEHKKGERKNKIPQLIYDEEKIKEHNKSQPYIFVIEIQIQIKIKIKIKIQAMEISAFKFFFNIFFRLRFIKSILMDSNEKIANIGVCFVIFHNTEEMSHIQIWKKKLEEENSV